MIFLHPGMAKSATTSLQRLAFARHPEIKYLGLPTADPAAKAAIREICRADSLWYDGERVRRALAARLHGGERTVLLSYENFTLYESKDKGLVAERLFELFPDARVFFTIRRQQDVLSAWYLQKTQKHLRHAHFIEFEPWWAMVSDLPHRSILDDLRYHDIIARYAELFGRERVRVFLHEDLVADAGAFCREVAGFLGVDAQQFERLLSEGHENPTIPASLLTYGRTFMRWLPRRFARKLARKLIARGGERARVDLPPEVVAFVRELCAEGNRELARVFDLPLERHGYLLGAGSDGLRAPPCGRRP